MKKKLVLGFVSMTTSGFQAEYSSGCECVGCNCDCWCDWG
jgi:hypothetical protein